MGEKKERETGACRLYLKLSLGLLETVDRVRRDDRRKCHFGEITVFKAPWRRPQSQASGISAIVMVAIYFIPRWICFRVFKCVILFVHLVTFHSSLSWANCLYIINEETHLKTGSVMLLLLYSKLMVWPGHLFERWLESKDLGRVQISLQINSSCLQQDMILVIISLWTQLVWKYTTIFTCMTFSMSWAFLFLFLPLP